MRSSGRVLLGVRPETLRLVPIDAGPVWTGTVVLVELRGPEAVVTVESGAMNLKVLVSSGNRPEVGGRIGVALQPGSCLLFDEETGRRLAA